MKNKSFLGGIGVLLALFFHFQAHSQGNEMRIIYAGRALMSEQLILNWDINYHFPMDGTLSYNKYFARGSGVYLINGTFRAEAGLLGSYAFLKDQNDISEIRFFEGVEIRWPRIDNIKVKQRIRLEQRLNNEINSDLDEFIHRFRYRILVPFALNNPDIVNNTWYMAPGVELMSNLNEDIGKFVNRGRIILRLGYKFNNRFSLEANYWYQTTRSELDPSELSDRHIFRLRFRQFINYEY